MKGLRPLQVVKPMSYPRGYGTRHLVPGDVFSARSARDHKLLLASKKVREVRDPADVPAPPLAVAEKIAEQFPDMKALREEYTVVVGRAPWNGWSADTLRIKIAEAKGA